MATITKTTISTIKQFSTFLEKQLPLSKESTLWFRGCGKATYSLSPSIHRHATISVQEKIIELKVMINNGEI